MEAINKKLILRAEVEHREFACSFPTRSGSQKQLGFMSNLSERKVRYLKATEAGKEEV